MLASLIFATVLQLSAHQSFPSIASTSNGSEGHSIQLDVIELVIIIHLPQEASDAPLRKKRQANDLHRCFTCDCCCSQSFLLLADGAADAIEEVLTARQESFKFMNHPAIECQ